MHSIFIQCAVPKNKIPVAAGQLKKWAQAVLKHQIIDAEITIRIVDVIEMTTLNTQYRHKTGATNVLSFSYNDQYNKIQGDIAICADIVNQEATAQIKTPIAHWAHMVVHGTLHLLGYDHETLEEATIMESLEITILQSLGFSNPYIQVNDNG